MIRLSAAMPGTVLLSALGSTVATAAEATANGIITYVTGSNQAEKMSDCRTLLRLHDKGVVNAADTASPFHLISQDCYQNMLLDEKGNIADGGGHCVSFDKSGDGYWNWWNFTAVGSKWEVYHGTGKFAGMSGGGTCKPLANFSDRYTLSCEGTVVMK